MPALNWGLIQDGGVFESLMHAVLYTNDPQTVLFGRPGKDAGQDARTADGTVVYQSKYRDSLDMDGAVKLALEELQKIEKYRAVTHANYEHWKSANRWVLFANFSINSNDDVKWKSKVVAEFARVGLVAEYWTKEIIEGKLAERPEVREVFFGQENRVLIGLKEAHDLLQSERVGSNFLDTPMLGRDTEIALVKDFISSAEKRVLPIVGSGGIGKSRFLYENLVILSNEGWRVLWGLPEAMTKSSNWFKLLNGTQKTCVALDDPEDPGLLRAVIEQLATVERRNWRVLISCRTNRSDLLGRYKTNRNVEKAIRLNALDELDSKTLLNSRLGHEADEPWLHRTYRFARGNPGWLCLIAALAKQGKLNELPPKADDIAELYVKTCLETFVDTDSECAHTLLNWLALWGRIVVESGGDERDEIAFLDKQGIPKAALHNILRRLVESGLVRNWGIGKRLYGIDSLLVRQRILSGWLLLETGPGEYSVSPAGKELVSMLLLSDLPCVEETLQTISHFSLSRLETQDAYSLLRPIFNAMVTTAKDTDLVGQIHLAELVAKLGIADPESALDVLIAIRGNTKDDQVVENPFWGKVDFTRSQLLSTLSWTLFNLAQSVEDSVVARRFLAEFEDLALVESGCTPSDPGKSPLQLLDRLLCKSRGSVAFSQPAYEMAVSRLHSRDCRPFVRVLSQCILEPRRETSDWVANWTIGFSSSAILPHSPAWERLVSLREKLFDSLQTEKADELRDHAWTLLSDSHHSLHYATAHYRMTDENHRKYRAVLIDDLTRCAAILKTPPTLGEATHARRMWEWYLKYGQDNALLTRARECEQIYSGLSKWRIHDFFQFDYDERLVIETDRVAKSLREANDPSVFADFFDEVTRYLSSARGNSEDMADEMQLAALANRLADLFDLDATGTTTPLTAFVLSILSARETVDPRSRSFAIMVSKAHLKQIKVSGESNSREWLDRLLAHAPTQSSVLYGLYSNAHPDSTGELSRDEMKCVLSHQAEFIPREWFWLLGVFAGAVDDTLWKHAIESLKSIGDDRYEASNCLSLFVRSSHVTFRRYERSPPPEFLNAILESIIKYRLDGVLFESHELEAMIKRSGFVPDMRFFASLMQSRVELENIPERDDRLTILPHDFNVNNWCKFDPMSAADVSAFHDVCRLALDRTFTSTYLIPKYLPDIDPSGASVANFVAQCIANNNVAADSDTLTPLAYLASNYPVDSEAWVNIARPICEKALGLGREDREHLYYCLSRKGTGVIRSMPGEVSSYYVEARDHAKHLLDCEAQDSPLRPYRVWAVDSAEYDLRRETGRAEEFADE